MIAFSVGAGLLQLLGIALTLLGVAVVWSAISRALQSALEAGRRLERWLTLKRHGLRGWWAGLHGRPAPTIRVSSSIQLAYDITHELVRQRADDDGAFRSANGSLRSAPRRMLRTRRSTPSAAAWLCSSSSSGVRS